MSREGALKARKKVYLILFWIAVATFAAACGDKEGEDALLRFFGFFLLAVAGALIIAFGYWLAGKSAVLIGSFVGLFIAMIVEITISPDVQFALLGGILGISVDKVVAGASTDLPVTLVDRLALLVSKLADSIRDASAKADSPVRIRLARRAVWAGTLAVFTILLIARAADRIGLSGPLIWDRLSLLWSAHR
jgi:hypothetical protein